jgi:hypothetical protein
MFFIKIIGLSNVDNFPICYMVERILHCLGSRVNDNKTECNLVHWERRSEAPQIAVKRAVGAI